MKSPKQLIEDQLNEDAKVVTEGTVTIDPTRIVSMWIGNDEGIYSTVTEAADEIVESNDGDKDASVEELATRIENIVDEMNPNVTGIFGDFISQCISRVDWNEVANDNIDEAIGNYKDNHSDDEE